MVRRVLGLAVALLAIASYAAEPQPVASVLPDRSIGIVFPASTLASEVVKKQLATGLTTTFLATARKGGAKGAARIEIRYDLWDEVWVVRRIEFDQRVDRQRLASRADLEKWWATPVRMFPSAGDTSRVDIELAVLPFSADEEEDTRNWISKSGGVGGTGAGGGFVDVLIGTTLSARPMLTYRWRIDVH